MDVRRHRRAFSEFRPRDLYPKLSPELPIVPDFHLHSGKCASKLWLGVCAGVGAVLGSLLFLYTTFAGAVATLIGFVLAFALCWLYRVKLFPARWASPSSSELRVARLVCQLERIDVFDVEEAKASVERILAGLRAVFLAKPGIYSEKLTNFVTEALTKETTQVLLTENLTDIQLFLMKDAFPLISVTRLRRCYIPMMQFFAKRRVYCRAAILTKEITRAPSTKEHLRSVTSRECMLLSCLLETPGFAINLAETFKFCSRAVIGAELSLQCKPSDDERPSDEFLRKSVEIFHRRRLTAFYDCSKGLHIQLSLREQRGFECAAGILNSFSKDCRLLRQSLDSMGGLQVNSPTARERPLKHPSFWKLNQIPHRVRVPPAVGDFGSESFSMSILIDVRHPFQHEFDKLLEIEAEPLEYWQAVLKKPKAQVYSKKLKPSKVSMVKSFCTVNKSLEQVFNSLWCPEQRLKWDTHFTEYSVVDKNEHSEVIYYQVKTPFGVSNRDWVQRRAFIKDYPEQGTHILHYKSIEHPALPHRKGVVRAETILSGYLLRPAGLYTTTLTIISHNDIKGRLPKAFVNKFASRAPGEWVENLEKCTNT